MLLLGSRYTIDFAAYLFGLPIVVLLGCTAIVGFFLRNRFISVLASVPLVGFGGLGLLLALPIENGSEFTFLLSVIALAIGLLSIWMPYRKGK